MISAVACVVDDPNLIPAEMLAGERTSGEGGSEQPFDADASPDSSVFDADGGVIAEPEEMPTCRIYPCEFKCFSTYFCIETRSGTDASWVWRCADAGEWCP